MCCSNRKMENREKRDRMAVVYAVGIGPGNPEYMTQEAADIIARCTYIGGYTVYIDLVKQQYPEKQYFSTPMKREVERCRMALEYAQNGADTALVCSGDAGIYGMAGLLLQLLPEYPDADVQVVAGVTAAVSGAAVLGAPLGHDFCVISLSNLLTPEEIIEKRLNMAAEGDFALCLYNPRSRHRRDALSKACEVLLKKKSPETVCGWVKNIGRDGMEKKVLTLGELPGEDIDMFTTVFIGSSATENIGGRMVTPRGYENKRL